MSAEAIKMREVPNLSSVFQQTVTETFTVKLTRYSIIAGSIYFIDILMC